LVVKKFGFGVSIPVMAWATEGVQLKDSTRRISILTDFKRNSTENKPKKILETMGRVF